MMAQLSKAIEFFHPLDRLTARAIADDQESPLFFLFCYVSAAFRAGHLFVHLSNNQLYPLPQSVIDDEAQGLQEILLQGFLSLHESTHPMYVLDDNRLYLRRSSTLTSRINKHYAPLQKAEGRLKIDTEKAERMLQNFVLEKKLLEKQAGAIIHALKSPIATIWGGPGTGKTYTAGRLLQTLISCQKNQTPCRIAICAPTAKATQQLVRSIQATCPELAFDAKTLHALLDVRPFGYTIKKAHASALHYDLVLVDESSMIDAALFERLTQRLSSGTRLILLGDPDQLPPIEPGACFSHIIEHTSDTNTKLDRCMRAELETIVEFASQICKGKAEEALAFAKNCSADSGVSVNFVSENDYDAVLDEYLLSQEILLSSKDPQEHFLQFSKKRFLSPMRNGKFGVDAMNAQIQQKVGVKAKATPIMVCQNDYDLSLTNGQVGMLIDDKIYFETADGIRALPRVLVGAYELAWCLSVHKSQGSEFDEVILFLPPGSERFGRKMLYTAVTRAKKKIRIYTCQEVCQEVFLACIAQDSIRNTKFL